MKKNYKWIICILLLGMLVIVGIRMMSNPILAEETAESTTEETESTSEAISKASRLQETQVIQESASEEVVEAEKEETESSQTTEITVPEESTAPEAGHSNNNKAPDVTVSESNVKPPLVKETPTPNENEKAAPTEKTPAIAITEEERQKIQEEMPPVNKPEEVEENYQFSVIKNQTTEEFIESIGEFAQEIAWKNDLYASVMIAQAILETGSGNSTLSSAPNYNLFGIKGSYQGKSVNFSTQEDDGSGSWFTISAGFRKYPSYKESLEDYAVLLKKGIDGNGSFYSKTWKSNTKTYKDATAFLTGRYATDTQYDKKLNALIEAYQLTKFDNEEKVVSKSTKNTEEKKKTKKKAEKSNDFVSQGKRTKKESSDVTQEKEEEATNDSAYVIESQKEKEVPITKRPAREIFGSQWIPFLK